MRDEGLYLDDIVEAAEAIDVFLAGVDKEQFLNSDLLRSAVLQKLLIIGEASARLSKEFCNQHLEIDWADVVAFRNVAIHAYFAVNWNTVWNAATLDAPTLKAKVENIISEEFPNTD